MATHFRVLFIALCVATAIVLPLWSFLTQGPFLWHVSQPHFWQGSLELLLLFCVIYAALGLTCAKVRYALLLLVAGLYGRRHGVDLAMVTLFLYAQGIFSLGWMALKPVAANEMSGPDRFYLSLLVGLICFLLVLWISSLFGFGSVGALRMVTICVLGVAILMARAPLLVRGCLMLLPPHERIVRLGLAAGASLFLVLFAKIPSQVATNYDSMWYGLQLDKSMVADGNIFSGQGLVAIVHYYPKLYESLLLPFSGLESITLPTGVAVYCWLGLVATSFAILRILGIQKSLSILVCLYAGSIPAIANLALTTKGDVCAAWLVLLGIFFLFRFHQVGSIIFAAASLSALALAPLARLSVLPAVAVVIPFLLTAAWGRLRKKTLRMEGSAAACGLVVLLGLLLALVLGRSVLLSGVPFAAPKAMVVLAESLGMQLLYPVGLYPAAADFNWPIHAWVYFFLFPGGIGHLNITWVGNGWLLLPVMALALGWKSLRDLAGVKLVIPLLVLMFPLVLYSLKPDYERAIDGNWFISFIVAGCLLSGLLLGKIYEGNKLLIAVVMMAFTVSSTAVVLFTGNWGPGTRPLDLDFARLPFEFSDRKAWLLRKTARAEVYRFFDPLPDNTRAIGLYEGKGKASQDAQLHFGWMLPLRYEPIEIISWSRPEVVRSPAAFREYLLQASIQFVLLPRGFVSSENSVSAISTSLLRMRDERMASKVLSNASYEIWQISTDGGAAARRNSAAANTSVEDWGPKATAAGESFNEQPDGSSAVWIKIKGIKPSAANYLLFGSEKITNLAQGPAHITFAVPATAYAEPGDKTIKLFEAETGRWIDVGVFKVAAQSRQDNP